MLLWTSNCPGFLQNRLTSGYVIKYSSSQKTVQISNKFTKNVCDICSNATKTRDSILKWPQQANKWYRLVIERRHHINLYCKLTECFLYDGIVLISVVNFYWKHYLKKAKLKFLFRNPNKSVFPKSESTENTSTTICFLIRVLSQRDSDTGLSLWILRNFSE